MILKLRALQMYVLPLTHGERIHALSDYADAGGLK